MYNYTPYTADTARADADRLRNAADITADLLSEIRGRLAETEGVRRPGPDIDYPDVSDALDLTDHLIKGGDIDGFGRLADELDAAADALGDLITNVAPKRVRKKKAAQPVNPPTRTADQIWTHDGKASK
jgi:hypothetical protein